MSRALTGPLSFGLSKAIASPEGGGVVIDLDAYLAALSGGFRFNTRKTDRYFQESNGVTAADDVGETIGLALDQRLWGGNTLSGLMAAQPELLTNPNFDSDTAWFKGTGWTIAGGRAIHTGATPDYLTQGTPAAGQFYQCMVDVAVATGSGFPQLYLGNAPVIAVMVAPGIYTYRAAGLAGGIGYAIRGVADAEVSSFSAKLIPGRHALQTGASTLRPTRQAESAKFDGTDDNWLTTYTAAAGNNFLMARTTVPASLAGTQVIAGASGSSANRFFVGINTSGFACGGVGSDSTGTIVGNTDLRGTEADIALTCDGATVRLIVNGVVEYEAAQNSTPTTTIPFRVGAYNNNGTGGSYYAGYVKECLAGTEFLTASLFNQIAAAITANH